MLTQNDAFLRCLVMCLILLPYIHGNATKAQSGSANTPPTSAPRLIMPSFDWANQPWTGDDRPYSTIRTQIDQSLAHGKLTIAVLQVNYAAWQQSPRDPLRLFRWAYADYTAAKNIFNLPPHSSPAEGAFLDCPDPHTYNYSRIRFLINWEGNSKVLLPLAKRLLARNPNDYPVQYNLAGRYGGNDPPAEKAASIKRAQALLKQYPNKPEIYAVLGGIYCDHWLFHKDPSDAKNAIDYYRKYLQMARPDDPWRKQAESWIKLMQSPPRKPS